MLTLILSANVKALIRACLEGYLCMFQPPRHALFT